MVKDIHHGQVKKTYFNACTPAVVENDRNLKTCLNHFAINKSKSEIRISGVINIAISCEIQRNVIKN